MSNVEPRSPFSAFRAQRFSTQLIRFSQLLAITPSQTGANGLLVHMPEVKSRKNTLLSNFTVSVVTTAEFDN